MDYAIDWLAPLNPELAMVPSENVFRLAKQQQSLTALDPHTPGLLFTSPDILVELATRVLKHTASQETSLLQAVPSPDTDDFDAEIPTLDPDFALFLNTETIF